MTSYFSSNTTSRGHGCLLGAAPAALQWRSGGHPDLPPRVPQQAALYRLPAAVGVPLLWPQLLLSFFTATLPSPPLCALMEQQPEGMGRGQGPTGGGSSH